MVLPKLLITGCNGIIGNILWRNLADTFELYGVDLCLTDQEENVFQADISNLEQVNAVFERIPSLAYVVHLAGDPRPDADWQSVLLNNIAGTRNLYEAAHKHGVKRVVFASSNHVTGAYEGFPPSLHTQPNPTLITSQDPIRPDGYYGVSKAAGEAIARMYYELHGLESVCLRIGSVLEDDNTNGDAHDESIWLSHRDLVQLVTKSLFGEVKFVIYYGVSNNQKRFWEFLTQSLRSVTSRKAMLQRVRKGATPSSKPVSILLPGRPRNTSLPGKRAIGGPNLPVLSGRLSNRLFRWQSARRS